MVKVLLICIGKRPESEIVFTVNIPVYLRYLGNLNGYLVYLLVNRADVGIRVNADRLKLCSVAHANAVYYKQYAGYDKGKRKSKKHCYQ